MSGAGEKEHRDLLFNGYVISVLQEKSYGNWWWCWFHSVMKVFIPLHSTLKRFMVEYFKVCMYILQQYKLNKPIRSGDMGEKAHWDAQTYKDLPLRTLASGLSHCIL